MGALKSFWGFMTYFGNWLWPYDEQTLDEC